ncbi:MAG: PHP domain-containing protein [Candidatus Zixiibacteriota bacterium]
MNDTIDLHMHTLHSDGTCTSAELLDLVRTSGVSAFSVTDHDTLAGYRDIAGMLKTGDPELITGVELSIAVGDDDVHMLAYLFDPDHEELNLALLDFQEKRNRRGRMIVEKLRDMGMDVPFEAVEERAGSSVIGRPHIAEAMVNLNKVGSYQEAFDRYISKNSPAYVPKVTLEPKAAIDLVHRSGGLTVMAHPFIDDSARHLDMLQYLGLDGIEVYHSSHTQNEVARLKRIAKERHLVISGGSDFHGREGRYGMVGSQRVPASLLADLKKHVEQIRGQV